MLARAKNGDAEAQYLMWDINMACHGGGAHLVQDRGKVRSLDEALEEAALWNIMSAEDVTLLYNRCHRFYGDISELGNPMEWLQRATEAGYPLAQAKTADLRLIQEVLKAQWKAAGHEEDIPVDNPGGLGDELAQKAPIGGDADPRALLQAAAKSGEPSVFFEIASAIKFLNPGDSPENQDINWMAWSYIACEHGADCSSFGEPVMVNCGPRDAHCVGVPATWLRLVNSDWTPIARRAQEIDAALANHQWDRLPGLTLAAAN
jgi:hypothetical protein